MVDPTEAARLMIDRIKDKIAKAESELMTKKKLVNALAAEEGMPAVYAETESDTPTTAGPTSIKSDQFCGLPLATRRPRRP